jgi:tRNA pseudouridine38-40 synthase
MAEPDLRRATHSTRMMQKFVAFIEYDGTGYHGWQLQKDLPTIQGALETALERILGTPTRVHGSGRTDAGVHAKGQVAHFPAEWSHPVHELQRACNALLPPDIIIHGLDYCSEAFHARHSANSKTYAYQILNRPIRSPLDRYYSWHYPHSLDMSLMNEAAGYLLDTHDFATFGNPTDGSRSTVRKIFFSRWDSLPSKGLLRYTVTGSGFLRYMVRSLVGTLVFVGNGKVTPSRFAEILKSCSRSLAGPTAPPHGLCLLHVDYEASDIDACTPR